MSELFTHGSTIAGFDKNEDQAFVCGDIQDDGMDAAINRHRN